VSPQKNCFAVAGNLHVGLNNQTMGKDSTKISKYKRLYTEAEQYYKGSNVLSHGCYRTRVNFAGYEVVSGHRSANNSEIDR
jgi:hypothetical protein